MLIRRSGSLYDNLYLLTLGESCHYAVGGPKQLAIIDPGHRTQIAALEKRLQQFNLSFQDVRYILATHLDANRVSGIPNLRQFTPQAQFVVPRRFISLLEDEALLKDLYTQDCQFADALSQHQPPAALAFDEFAKLMQADSTITQSDVISITDSIHIRFIPLPGHKEHAVGYYIEPYHFLIVDEVLGYYNGGALTAPGSDFSLSTTLETLKRLKDIELNGIGLPKMGVLTGKLVRKHLEELEQNIHDLCEESRKAFQEGLPDEHIFQSIQDSFFSQIPTDPALRAHYESTLASLWLQIEQNK